MPISEWGSDEGGGRKSRPANRVFSGLLLLGCLPSAAVLAADTVSNPAGCAGEADDLRRLACYDRLFRPAADSGRELAEAAAAQGEGGQALSAMVRFWELGPENKRGTFTVHTFQPNYLLPAHATTSINRQPASPTHPHSAAHADYRQVEAKLQVSLRAKMLENIGPAGGDLWFAYTQRSLWQVWDSDGSAPFRSTDYQPEAIYVQPLPANLSPLPGGWRARLLQFGLAHQSNGQSDPLSRSWNRVYAGVGLEKGDFGLFLRYHQRLREKRENDDNPDLLHYLGRGEAGLAWLPGRATAQLTLRSNFNSWRRGSLQFDWTYPVLPSQPEGLRWYLQAFTGYGETLLDYNHRQSRLGFGVTLFQF